jgi:4-amino-4-deoxy-L-arabinose transferase-like glycosyltransferase
MNKSRTILLNNPSFLVLCLLLVFFTLLGVLSVQNISTTYDEVTHFAYGEQMLLGNSQRTGIHGDSNMPFLAWNALPKSIGLYLPAGRIRSFLTNFDTARGMTLIFSVIVALLVFHWSRSLYGTVPAFASLLLYVFDPNIIAHSQLVTTDIYAAGTTTLVFYFLWKFAHERTWANGLIFGFALGLSELAKYTTIVLIPLSLLTLFLYDIPSFFASLLAFGKAKAFFIRYIVYIAVTAVVLVLVINVGFLFNRTFTFLGNYKFRSDWFQTLQAHTALRALPVPFPYPYLDGLDWMRHTQTSGGNSGTIYLLGNLNKEGFPGYYIIASLLKVPISTQIIIFAALILYFTQPNRRRNFFRDEIFLFTPILFYSIYFNFLFNVQIGIRYYLIFFPLLYIFAGSLFKEWKEFRLIQKISGFALLAYLVVSVLSYYPYYLTYFNELIWNRTLAYKYLAEHPNAILEPQTPQAGLLVVGVNHLVGVNDDPAKFAWLRNNFEPVGTIANSILIYQVSSDQLERLNLIK